MSKRYLLTLCAVVLVTSTLSFAQTAAQVDFWKSTVATSTISDISKKLADPASPKWPTIVSIYAAQQLPSVQKKLANECVQLAQELQHKIAGQFNPNPKTDSVENESEISVYASIAKALNSAGGYTNLLLADNVMRLAIFRISGWLLIHPESTDYTKKLVMMLDVPEVHIKQLLESLSNQDSEIQNKLSEIQKIQITDNFAQACTALGINWTEIYVPYSNQTGELLQSPSVIRLAFRLAQSEAMINVNIKGTIRFFEVGGLYSELNEKDIRAFESRMGKEIGLYRYPILQVRRFKPSDVLTVVELHKNPDIQAAWLNAALK